MERKDFIEKVGLSAAGILVFGCMQSCSKSGSAPEAPGNNNSTTPKTIDFTINLSIAPYNVLNTAGGFYIDPINRIIIARTLSNEYIAVSSVCTHQNVTVEYQGNSNRFYCPGHESTFTNAGAVSNGPATQALKQYQTALTNNNLRVFS
jgi:cytochrome b6-f complex iron-sulfur subunit